jgi:CRISPR-associated protein Cas1
MGIVEVDGEEELQVPEHHIGSVVIFGRVMVSTGAYKWSSESGKPITFLTHYGKFLGRFEGPTTGNVKLRFQQVEGLDREDFKTDTAHSMIAAKIQNNRFLIRRPLRDGTEFEEKLQRAEKKLGDSLADLESSSNLEEVRGKEGDASRTVFDVFDCMIKQNRSSFEIDGRNRRPPRDPLNAVLSFLYTLIRHDCTSALESVGLDPQVGYLHGLRSGRPALALDLMEELRPVLGDRLALRLINRKQLQPDDFDGRTGGAVEMTEDARKTLIEEYQKRKEDEVDHEMFENPIPLGLVPQIQARLLARVLRGDLEKYPPFLYRG